MGDALRQIADGMRFQERAPVGGWLQSEHIPITDLMVAFGDVEAGADRQYALMIKLHVTEAARG